MTEGLGASWTLLFLSSVEKISYNCIHDAAQYPCITCSCLGALRKHNSVGCLEDTVRWEGLQHHLRAPELHFRTYWHFWIWAIVGQAFGLKYIPGLFKTVCCGFKNYFPAVVKAFIKCLFPSFALSYKMCFSFSWASHIITDLWGLRLSGQVPGLWSLW